MRTLSQVTANGEHGVAVFQHANGNELRVTLANRSDYDELPPDTDPRGPYTVGGRDIRPGNGYVFSRASWGTKWNTADGLLAPGDYAVIETDALLLKLEDPNSRYARQALLEREDYTGDPTMSAQINTSPLRQKRDIDGNDIIIVGGVLS